MVEIMEYERLRETERRSLPKNVRQVGDCRGHFRIYVEDYVMTYLRRISEPGRVDARGAVLFGKRCETEDGPAVFIDGAIEAGNLELDLDETVFNDRIWERLLEKGKCFFPEREVAGWFLSRIGFSVEINQKIINTHLKNFPGEQMVLYMIDALEKEDALYLCENRQMKRQKGYYIYYEKNTAMQEYMLSTSEKRPQESEGGNQKNELRRDRKIVNNYRKMNSYSRKCKKQDFKIRIIRKACAFLILIMGAYIISQAGERFLKVNLKNYAVETFHNLINGTGGTVPVIEEVEKSENLTDLIGPAPADTTKTEENTETNGYMNEPGTDAGSLKEEETEETIMVENPVYYTIQKGDTLAAICRKMYASDRYVDELARANGLNNADEIYEGQKILIPSME